MTFSFVVAMVLAYLLGGLPIGLLIGRAMGIRDIRKYGSGNIGATNVLRVLGAKAGIAVWVIDCLKGVIPVLLARHAFGLEGWGVGLAGVSAMVGHCYSPYLNFTGGRGVSTSAGVMFGLFWPLGVLCFAVFALLVAKTKYVSLGSVLGAASAVVWCLVFTTFIQPYTVAYALSAALCAVFIVIRHIPNIRRLLAGTERKIGERVEVTEETADE